jgi:LysR family hydrogen peroxide-inducible transcriptional activator
MEIEQLRQFLIVAERQNFTRAAEEIGVSQPALSRSIARLEEELGQPVFERQTRKVVLTDAGELLRSRAEQILGMVDDTKAEISDDGESGRIRLAAIPTIAPFYLPELLRRFTVEHPKALLTVQEDTTDNLLKRCTNGDIDLAIVALPITAKYLEVETLFEEELLLVLAPEHPLLKKKQIRLTDIEPLPFVLLGEAHCLSANIETFCHQRSFHPVSVERTSQLATVQELVSLNHGVSMVPAMARALDDSDRRAYRSITGPKPTRKIAMIWNPYRFQSYLLRKFKELVRESDSTIN